MKHGKILLVAGLTSAAVFTFPTPALASLTSYTANGVDFVHMQGSGFDVSWTKDGNLFQTLANSYVGGPTALVNAVIASVPGGKINGTPNYYDTPSYSGYHTLSSQDFNNLTGGTSWFGAQAFISYLNTISYGGSSQWQLPTVTDTGTPGCNISYSGTDCGYNVNNSTNALAQLYYGELNKKGYVNTSGALQSGYGIFGNGGFSTGSVGPFTNVRSNLYWTVTEDALNPDKALIFGTFDGGQGPFIKYDPDGSRLWTWAFTPGLVSAVPAPSAIWLFGSGLLGLIGLKRSNKTT